MVIMRDQLCDDPIVIHSPKSDLIRTSVNPNFAYARTLHYSLYLKYIECVENVLSELK